jgi:hypothetical protein
MDLLADVADDAADWTAGSVRLAAQELRGSSTRVNSSPALRPGARHCEHQLRWHKPGAR